jgi:hypothetical protein
MIYVYYSMIGSYSQVYTVLCITIFKYKYLLCVTHLHVQSLE